MEYLRCYVWFDYENEGYYLAGYQRKNVSWSYIKPHMVTDKTVFYLVIDN